MAINKSVKIQSSFYSYPLGNLVLETLLPPGNFLLPRAFMPMELLTHWGRVTHICVGSLTIIGSENGLSPDWRQAIIWTNAVILLIGTLGTNFSEILSKIYTFSFKKMHLKTLSAKLRPFSLGLNVLTWLTINHQVIILQWTLAHKKTWPNIS